MRNALGLTLASVGAAVVIVAVWFWTASPRADLTVAATLSAPASRAACRDRFRQTNPDTRKC